MSFNMSFNCEPYSSLLGNCCTAPNGDNFCNTSDMLRNIGMPLLTSSFLISPFVWCVYKKSMDAAANAMGNLRQRFRNLSSTSSSSGTSATTASTVLTSTTTSSSAVTSSLSSSSGATTTSTVPTSTTTSSSSSSSATSSLSSSSSATTTSTVPTSTTTSSSSSSTASSSLSSPVVSSSSSSLSSSSGATTTSTVPTSTTTSSSSSSAATSSLPSSSSSSSSILFNLFSRKTHSLASTTNTMPKPITLKPLGDIKIGVGMGFENNGQDCAIAAALYGLFGTTDNLDGIVKHAPSDAPEQRALKNKLTEMINLLRTKGCVPRNHMTELRSLLEISGELTSPDHIIDVIKQKLGVNDAIVNVDLSTTSGPLKISDGLNNIFNTLEAPTAQALIVNGQSTATRNAKQYEPQMEVTVKGQKYRLASVTVNTGGHYIVYSCSPKNTSFVMANSISTPVIRSALGLHSVINHEQSSERNYTKDQGAQKLLSLKGIATIEYDWDKVKQGSQYIYVKVEEDE